MHTWSAPKRFTMTANYSAIIIAYLRSFARSGPEINQDNPETSKKLTMNVKVVIDVLRLKSISVITNIHAHFFIYS